MSHVSIKELEILYGERDSPDCLVAVEHFNLEVQHGEFLSIVGPSGCGKSTMLMAVDGLVPISGGRITVNGQTVLSPGPDRAVVFQEFALLPWRTIESNVLFGMELRRVAREKRVSRAHQFLKMVGLSGFHRAYPHQLSGGMRQRVAIARALAVDPDIVLMDEPFGALDAQTREIMGNELLQIWEQARKTVLFVTHSLDEAIFLSDRVAVVTSRPGRVKELLTVDLPRPRRPEVRNSPEFVAIRSQLWELLQDEVQRAMIVERG